MRHPFSALLAAASLSLGAPLLAATSEPKPPVPPGGNKPGVVGKKPATNEKKEAKPEPKAKAKALAESDSLVPTTVDAATQMALDAAKAAQAEVAKLSAIGGKVVTAENAKLAEAAVTVGVAAAKELTKATAPENKEAKPDAEAPAKGDNKKLFGKKAE